MTRIDCVPVTELTNKHLVSNYHEMPRVRRRWPRKSKPDIPETYRMGKGHETFFYDKGVWLERRHQELVAEMRRRGFTVNYPELDLSHWPGHAMNDWIPTDEALAVDRARIKERLGK